MLAIEAQTCAHNPMTPGCGCRRKLCLRQSGKLFAGAKYCPYKYG